MLAGRVAEPGEFIGKNYHCQSHAGVARLRDDGFPAKVSTMISLCMGASIIFMPAQRCAWEKWTVRFVIMLDETQQRMAEAQPTGIFCQCRTN